jgi:C-terminal processing protease CtpA/Prc
MVTARRFTVRRRAAPLRRLAAALGLASALAGCGGAPGQETVTPADAAPVDAVSDADWVRSVMTQTYLYAERMPAADLSATTDAARALEALRVNPPDRFSYVERRDRYEAFFDEGRTVGLGIALRIEADRLRLRLVQPQAPAGRAGLRRGDAIVSIDDAPVAGLIAARAVDDAFGPAEAGRIVRLGVERDGVRREVVLEKAEYPLAAVLATRVIERPGGLVGYVALYAFVEPARAAWAEALAALRAAGARRLVVDLRDNGGGRLNVAAEIAAALAPPSAIGQPFTELRHNARRAGDDRTIRVPEQPLAGAFEQVAWLVSDVTCSASESLIVGLRPYRDDPVIGTRTCGKPVGAEPQVRGDLLLSLLTFASRNRDGLTDWFDGLAPTCAVADEPYLPLGDPADPRLAEALRRLETGHCGDTTAKSVEGNGGTAPASSGLTRETGLH